MKTATQLTDAIGLDRSDIFDLESSYVEGLSVDVRDGARQGYFHPSAVGACGRKQVYEYIRTPFIGEVPGESLEIFDLGHAIHDLVGKKLLKVGAMLRSKSYGYELQLEVPYDRKTDELFTDLSIGGTTDGILKIWSEGWEQRSILEIKSINKDGFEKLKGPKHPHLMQAHLYAYRFSCPIIYIWYYCKDNSKRRVYPVVFDHAIFDDAIKYFDKLMRHVEAGTLPERDEDFYLCPRCEYRDTCKPSALQQITSKANSKALNTARNRGRM